MTEQEHFEKYKWVYVKDVISKERCAELTNALQGAIDHGGSRKDIQCPLSESIYAFRPFEILLQELVPVISKATGINVLPTYSFTRWYVTGEELKPHIDRHACEISATLTLGHEAGSANWPIAISPNEDLSDAVYNTIDIGSLVVYRGNEMYHWRDIYEGKWHAQVFLHYVNANGPYAGEAFDKRKNLNV